MPSKSFDFNPDSCRDHNAIHNGSSLNFMRSRISSWHVKGVAAKYFSVIMSMLMHFSVSNHAKLFLVNLHIAWI